MNKLFSLGYAERWGDAGMLVLRVALGAVFFMHGWQKIFEFTVPGVAEGLFNQLLHWPMPMLLAYLLSYGELIAGAALILGLLTHWAAKIGVIISLVAFLGVHIKNGFFLTTGGYEYILLILAASISVMIMGGGKYSLDHWLKNRLSPAPME